MKPKVVISRCIEFDKCRWNGLTIASPIVRSLKKHIDFIPVCPEVEIGLGVPRDPIRLVQQNEDIKLYDPAGELDHTDKMLTFSDSFLAGLPKVAGFILKSRSPSCGTGNVKIYSQKGHVISGKGTGKFAEKVLSLSPLLAIEDEARLLNLRIREHFLTKLYTLTAFAGIEHKPGSLMEFHANNKYLFMAYNQSKLKDAGAVAANHEKHDFARVLQDYTLLLGEIFSAMPRNSANINVLQHIFGYFSGKHLNAQEKKLFLELLEQYRNFQIPLVTMTSILKMWTVKYDIKYLEKQTYLQPFPTELQTIFDTGKGRVSKQL